MKKILALSIMMVLCILNCGCSKDKTVSESAKSFVIGGIAPVSGDYEKIGKSVKQGAQIAVDKINSEGGISVDNVQYKVVLDFANDENNIEVIKYAYDKVKTARAKAIIGGITQETAKAISDMAVKDDLIVISPTLIESSTEENNIIYKMCKSYAHQGKMMANYLYNSKIENVAVLYPQEDVQAAAISDAFVKEYNKIGGVVTTSEIYSSEKETVKENLKNSLENITKTETETKMIFAPVDSQQAFYICKLIQEQNYKFKMSGCDGWKTMVDKIEDNTIIDGTVFFSQFVNTSEKTVVKDFIEQYQKLYLEEPDVYAANAYDAVYAIVNAANSAQSVEAKELMEGIKNIEFNGVTGNDIKFNLNGDNKKTVEFIEIKNGRNVPSS